MPDAPHGPRSLTGRTPEGIAPRALLLPLPIRQPRAPLHCACNAALDLRQGCLAGPLDLGQRLRRLHPVRPEALPPLGPRGLPHPAHQRVDRDGFVRDALGALGPGMVRAPCPLRALAAPDGDRGTHPIRGHGARHALRRGGDGALGPVAHQAMRSLPQTRLHQRLARRRLARLAAPRQERPLPLAPPQGVGQVRERLPALSRGLIAPTGGAPMPRGMGRPMAARRVEHRAGAPLERLAPDRARERIQAVRPTAHAHAPHHCRGLGKGRAAQRRDRQADVPIAAPCMEALTPLAHPGIDRALGTPSAPRRLTAQGHQRRALAAVQTAIGAVPDLCRSAPRAPLGHQTVVRGGLRARMGVRKRFPGLGKDLLQDTPVPGGGCQHPRPPREGLGMVAGPGLYHGSSALSTPPQRSRGILPHSRSNCLQINHKK